VGVDKVLVLRHRDTENFLAPAGLTPCADAALRFGDAREARRFAGNLCDPGAFELVERPTERAA
jgi:hypothetical protein